MKVIFTSFFLLTFYTLLVAQVNPEQGLTGKVTGLNNSTDSSDIQVSFRCFQPKLSDTALLIVDGVLTKLNLLNQINPNDIKSVNFLKSEDISTIYS